MPIKPDQHVIDSWNAMCRYEERYVALLDILGFSELLYNEQLNHVFCGILSSVTTITQNSDAKGSCYENVDIAVISDTIVISVKTDQRNGMRYLLQSTQGIIGTFLSEGIITRGAFTFGKLYHEGNVVFGPALVEAHKLEQGSAIYPRHILLKETALAIIAGNNEEADVYRELYNDFIEDQDGFLYYDYFTHALLGQKSEPKRELVNDIRRVITHNLANAEMKSHIRAKYEWMLNHYNSAIAFHCKIGTISRLDLLKWIIEIEKGDHDFAHTTM